MSEPIRFYYRNQINRDDAQMLYFRAVADQTKIPLMIYNWPQVTGVDISPAAVAALSEHPNIIAYIDSFLEGARMCAVTELSPACVFLDALCKARRD